MTATDARKKFYTVIEKAKKPGMAITITHEGLPKVVVMSFEEYEGWMETMEIMADPKLASELKGMMRDMENGKLHENTVPWDDVKKKLKL